MLDVKTPKIDGITVLRRIREEVSVRTVPVVVRTSSAEGCDALESYRLDADSYIVKPVDTAEFDKIIGDIGFYWMLGNEVPS